MDTELPRSESAGSPHRFGSRQRRGLRGGMIAVLTGVLIFGALTVPATPTNAATNKKKTTTTVKKKSTTTIKKKSTTTIKGKSTTTVSKKTTTTTGSKKSTTTVKSSESTPGTTNPVGSAGSSSSTTKAGSTTLPVTGPGGKVTYYIPGTGRVLDLGAADVAKLAAGARVDIDVRGAAGLAAAGVGSVIVDITALNPTQSGKITLTPVASDYARSVVSSSAVFVSGATTVNRVAVPVGRDASVRVESTPGPQGLTIAVVGWVVTTDVGVAEPNGTAIGPCRVVDTAAGLGLSGLVTTTRSFEVKTTDVGKVPASTSATPPAMVLVGVTASGATAASDVNVQPTGQQSPTLSLQASANVNPTGVYAVPIGVDPRVAFYVPNGAVNLTIDILGWIDRDGLAKSAGPC